MTPKQRAKAYRKIAEYIDSSESYKEYHVCNELEGRFDGDSSEETFPEFHLFRHPGGFYSWFGHSMEMDKEGFDYNVANQGRIIALLFCELMAKDNICV